VSEPSAIERKKAQNAMMHPTKKRDKSIKGRMACNGAPTREWLGREELASPTAAQESTMSLAVADARERRDVMTSNVPSALIQAALKCNDGDEWAIMEITGVLVNIPLADDPDSCGGHVVHENGKKVLHVTVLRAICGMSISASLWCGKFRIDLEENGFVFNPCDVRVANKTVDDKQQTIRFHVDDAMSSHVDAKVNDNFEKWLNKVHGKHGEVKSTQGDAHDCLGVVFVFDKMKGKVTCQMFDCLDGMFKEFPLKFSESVKVTSPAKVDMFGEDLSKRLDPEKKQLFHTTVAKGSFLSERARPDIQPVAPVLCTRVKNPGRNNWKKLVKMMKFL